MEIESRREIQITLDCKIVDNGNGYTAILSHADFDGHLSCTATNMKMLDLQLQSVDDKTPEPTDPLQLILQSAEKLVEGVRDLKELAKS